MTLNQLIESLQRFRDEYPLTADNPVSVRVKRTATKSERTENFSLSAGFPHSEKLAEVQIYCSIYKPKE